MEWRNEQLMGKLDMSKAFQETGQISLTVLLTERVLY